MLLVIDNYDSFTYNLVQYLLELGQELDVRRNDKVTVAEIEALDPAGIIVSPGPCTPDEAGISLAAVERFGPTTPLLGVCLGHQCVGQAYGGDIVAAPELMHGKTSAIHHDGRGIFASLPEPFEATRYHSLIVDRATLPQDLEVSAETADGLIMGVRHRSHPVNGVQFHPESILTSAGKDLLAGFLKHHRLEVTA
ncbi:MAG: aminodeoxychorismate/anthranilate synthase component II [Chloroflexota bacterium]|jgi:anthranilate synthase/aminodeoxychorismate synthase-like glutamine amidotransferase|nr:aminodeoxychorismate/anthranilate synthase component II [Chloroflexota bacterium]MDP6758150.1 aminodeoxychorismate/anthranilate synthase component II [Chloroflexota bacterium]